MYLNANDCCVSNTANMSIEKKIEFIETKSNKLTRELQQFKLFQNRTGNKQQ